MVPPPSPAVTNAQRLEPTYEGLKLLTLGLGHVLYQLFGAYL